VPTDVGSGPGFVPTWYWLHFDQSRLEEFIELRRPVDVHAEQHISNAMVQIDKNYEECGLTSLMHAL
jgi:hypothetical protein